MKKNLRLLCLGLVAATFTCGFAQEDKTSLLQNADMELGLKGWGFDGEKLMGKNTKSPAAKTGFYGMNQGVLEAWNGNLSGLADGYVMQRLSNLPSGTYVFGAYAAASKQNHRTSRRVEVAPGDTVTKYEYWSNRDSIEGVVLFANQAKVSVATNNPDWHGVSCMKNGVYNEGHAMKFNVAVTLTEEDEKKGYMDVGIRYTNTNANYVVWDNATLYYFDDMSEADALDAMARIDVDNAVAIADTLMKEVMNADTLAALTTVLADAEKAEVTAANLWDELDKIFLIAGKARKSIADYTALKKNLDAARLVAEGTWRDAYADILKPMLDGAIAKADSAYGAKKMNREELTALRKQLNWAAGDMKIDSVALARDVLTDFIESAKLHENEPGYYTSLQIAELEAIVEELTDVYNAWEADSEKEEYAEREVDPSTLYAYIARINAAIEAVENNKISTEYTKMPIEFKAGENGWIEGAEWLDENKGLVHYKSPLYRFQGKIQNFRITVNKSKNGQVYFCLSGLKFYDGAGNLIPLTEENLSTNADHNTLNSTADGGGISAMFDDDNDSYFHSAWQNGPSEAHYLEVNLPNGGYDAFSFQMISRSNSNGWDQSHTFPGEMVISTPMPERDNLMALLETAKNRNAYSIPEPGFYTQDFSALLEEIAKVEAALVGYPSETECAEMAEELTDVLSDFREALEADASIYLPEKGKQYRIISGVPGFYEKQFVEKALTVNMADTTLWWENVCADCLKQVFEFEPIMQEDEHVIITEDDVNYYCYTMKNVDMGLYVDSAFIGNKLKLVEAATDTVMLKSLGRGQWNILVRGESLHAGDHYSGNPSTSKGAYGGIYGIGSGICAFSSGLDDASAWFIREVKNVPCDVTVADGAFESEFIHFESANTITLTADKDCAFEGLALYDLYGAPIAIDTVVVSGKTATITQEVNLVGCSFAFNNKENVTSVQFDAFYYIAPIELLQAAYDEAVAVAPVEGTAVGEIADISAYTAALEAAEAILDGGAADEEEIDAAIKRLEESVEGLVMNMPEDGKYYFIYNAVEAFETNKGYKMTMYVDDTDTLKWTHENYLDWNRYWQFELATEEELKAAGMKAGTCAYYVKNVATEMYIADGGATSAQVGLTEDKEAALPYVVTMLGVGTEAALDGLGQSGKRLHANEHGNGKGDGSNIVYWNAAAGSASAWHIVEAQYDVTDIDFTEIETEKAVVKGTYDLFGRRIVAPTAPGIYIIDGRKKLVK